MSGVPCAVTTALAAVLLVACGPNSTADDPGVTSLPYGAALTGPSTAEGVGTSPAREPVVPSGAARSASPETTLATSTDLEPSVSPDTAQQAQDEVEKLTLDYFHAQEDVALGLADTEVLYPFTTTIGQERVVILNHLNPPVYTQTGRTTYELLGSEVQNPEEITVYVCSDTSGVEVFGEDGTNYTDPDRVLRMRNDVTVVRYTGQWLVHESTNTVSTC